MTSASDNNGELPAIIGGAAVRPQGPPDWPGVDPAVSAAVESALADGTWGKYHGPHCSQLAERLAEYHQCEHAILCSSGTAAVELALRGLKVGAGDEVVLAAYDFKGNFQDVLTVGAVPVLVDVFADNSNLDPDGLEEAIGPKTRAIIASHLHGGVVPMSDVMQIARRHGVPVIEDACQMPGAVIEGRIAGTVGDVGIHSCGGSKLLSAGRGGALVTNDAELVQRVRLYSHRGNEAYPLSELQAVALLPQLDQLDVRNAQRQRNADRLRQLLADQTGLAALDNSGTTALPGYYKFGFTYDVGAFSGLSRESFADSMRAEGIAVDPGFRALHRIHSRRRFRTVGDLHNAERSDECVLTLHHPFLLGSDEDIEQIVIAIDKIRRHATMIQQQK
ncbi:MAG: DegT/DnrJ/EryC1/StrS family aminotransferase [Planctomycetaceae bacterium]|nr:DegT/DnrJ/EryC1/StrS family aminotransferase [Planctomycetaceae bacterium]